MKKINTIIPLTLSLFMALTMTVYAESVDGIPSANGADVEEVKGDIGKVTIEENVAEETFSEDPSAAIGNIDNDESSNIEVDIEEAFNEKAVEEVLLDGEISRQDLTLNSETMVASGTCGENAKWTLTGSGDELVLTISGTGEMIDYSENNRAPWFESYSTRIKRLCIEDGITTIGAYAFDHCYNIIEVSISDSVTSIKKASFQDSFGFTSITIPNNVTSIEDYAFSGCSDLMSITLPSSVTSLGKYVFSRCNNLESITILGGVTKINEHVFSDCSKLISVILPDSVMSIGDYAFYKCGSLANIKLPDSVTSIGSHAFSSCYSLDGITLPEDLTDIGWSTFQGCSSLTSINIPKGVTSIGWYVFKDCINLERVMIPYGVTEIGKDTFANCIGLTSIDIPDSVISLSSCFSGCSGLTSINLSDSLKSLDGTFSDCKNLRSIILPDSIQSIGGHTFAGCSSLTNIVIPDGVTSLGKLAFFNCGSLTNIVIPDGVTSLGESAFDACRGLKKVEVPETLWAIGSCAFLNCSSLESLDISNVTALGDRAFGNCNSLKSINISEKLTWIKDYTFSGCSSLKNVIIPDSVNKLSVGAFQECSQLECVTIPANIKFGTDMFYNGPFTNCNNLKYICYKGNESQWKSLEKGKLPAAKIYYSCDERVQDVILDTAIIVVKPGESLQLKATVMPTTAVNKTVFWTVEDEQLATISGNTITGVSEGSTPLVARSAQGYYEDSCLLVVGNTIAESENWAILETDIEGEYELILVGTDIWPDKAWNEYKKNITKVSFSDAVTDIEEYAFNYFTKLESIIIPNSVIRIHAKAFRYCNSLKSVTIPEGVASIGEEGFAGCSNLTSVTIPEGVTSIGKSAFSGCSSLASVTIPEGVTSIGEAVFSGCSSLTNVTIPKGVTNIGSYAFMNCSSLASVTIPEGVTSIGNFAFENCSNLASVTIPESVTSIGEEVFSGCSSLTSVTIPEGVMSIRDSAFKNCSGLKSVTIPSSLTTIEWSSFDECENIRYVCYAGTEPEWNGISISGCNEDLTTAKRYYSCDERVQDIILEEALIAIAPGEEIHLKATVMPVTAKDQTVVWTVEDERLASVTGEKIIGNIEGKTRIKAASVDCRFEASCTLVVGKIIDKGMSWALIESDVDGEYELILSGQSVSWNEEWSSYKDKISKVYCCDGVKSIGSGAFAYFSSLTSVIIPKSVTTIYWNAFNYCDNLTDIYYSGTREEWDALGLPWDITDKRRIVASGEVDMLRLYGDTRYFTSLAIADQLKKELGISEFESAVISTGANFPDALAGGYLANVHNAPILMISSGSKDAINAYVKANVNANSTIYVLGSTGAVSNAWISGIRSAGYKIKRLQGDNRYLTNIAILKELGVTAGSDILVATGKNYADALSASAVSMPILLVSDTLTASQKQYLNGLRGSKFHILGGAPAVSRAVETALRTYGSVDRIAGNDRYQTSVAIAERYFTSPSAVAMAYARNFPDGLCGGVLAAKMNAPLLLVNNPENTYKTAINYSKSKGVLKGVVFGSTSLVSDETVLKVGDGGGSVKYLKH